MISWHNPLPEHAKNCHHGNEPENSPQPESKPSPLWCRYAQELAEHLSHFHQLDAREGGEQVQRSPPCGPCSARAPLAACYRALLDRIASEATYGWRLSADEPDSLMCARPGLWSPGGQPPEPPGPTHATSGTNCSTLPFQRQVGTSSDCLALDNSKTLCGFGWRNQQPPAEPVV